MCFQCKRIQTFQIKTVFPVDSNTLLKWEIYIFWNSVFVSCISHLLSAEQHEISWTWSYLPFLIIHWPSGLGAGDASHLNHPATFSFPPFILAYLDGKGKHKFLSRTEWARLLHPPSLFFFSAFLHTNSISSLSLRREVSWPLGGWQHFKPMLQTSRATAKGSIIRMRLGLATAVFSHRSSDAHRRTCTWLHLHLLVLTHCLFSLFTRLTDRVSLSCSSGKSQSVWPQFSFQAKINEGGELLSH